MGLLWKGFLKIFWLCCWCLNLVGIGCGMIRVLFRIGSWINGLVVWFKVSFFSILVGFSLVMLNGKLWCISWWICLVLLDFSLVKFCLLIWVIMMIWFFMVMEWLLIFGMEFGLVRMGWIFLRILWLRLFRMLLFKRFLVIICRLLKISWII